MGMRTILKATTDVDMYMFSVCASAKLCTAIWKGAAECCLILHEVGKTKTT